MRSIFHVAAAVMILLETVQCLAEEPISVAVFDFEIIDMSLEGEIRGIQAAEQNRLGLISRQLRAELDNSAKFVVVEMEQEQRAGSEAGYLHGCHACAADIATSLGADYAVTGTVRKVSTLILSISLYFVDAGRPESVRVASVDIRGNTDESWSRGVSYLLRKRFLGDR